MPADDQRVPVDQRQPGELRQRADQPHGIDQLLLERRSSPSVAEDATPPRAPMNQMPVRACAIDAAYLGVTFKRFQAPSTRKRTGQDL